MPDWDLGRSVQNPGRTLMDAMGQKLRAHDYFTAPSYFQELTDGNFGGKMRQTRRQSHVRFSFPRGEIQS
jgi:hypothetical protein